MKLKCGFPGPQVLSLFEPFCLRMTFVQKDLHREGEEAKVSKICTDNDKMRKVTNWIWIWVNVTKSLISSPQFVAERFREVHQQTLAASKQTRKWPCTMDCAPAGYLKTSETGAKACQKVQTDFPLSNQLCLIKKVQKSTETSGHDGAMKPFPPVAWTWPPAIFSPT